MTSLVDIDHLRGWIGHEEKRVDVAAAAPIAGLAALLDYGDAPVPAETVPPLGHWLYFQPHVRQSLIDRDGHPQRGGFLPPVPFPRRMWAGSRLSFHAPIPVGGEIERRSVIADVRLKTGSASPLVFVTVRHEILAGRQLAIIEDQDIVYRPAEDISRAADTRPVSAMADAMRTVTPDSVQLFRFSALTFNAHRIHYDRDYARDIEGYAGLVVQGPFVAILLLDHFLRSTPGAQIKRFAFRGVRPLLDNATVDLCLRRSPDGAELWTRDAGGSMTMAAEVVVG